MTDQQKWRAEKLKQGLCGYCGKRPIAKGRSKIRCKWCLGQNEFAKVKYQAKIMPPVIYG